MLEDHETELSAKDAAAESVAAAHAAELAALQTQMAAQVEAMAVQPEAQLASFEQGPPDQEELLTAELLAMKPSARRKRAIDAGATVDEVNEAADGDEPIVAFARLIAKYEQVEQHFMKTAAAAAPAEQVPGQVEDKAKAEQTKAALTAEVQGMKISARKKRAKAAGATADEVDAAMDADDTVAAFAELLLALETGSGASGQQQEREQETAAAAAAPAEAGAEQMSDHEAHLDAEGSTTHNRTVDIEVPHGHVGGDSFTIGTEDKETACARRKKSLGFSLIKTSAGWMLKMEVTKIAFPCICRFEL